jgi:hypothetical protein
MKRLSLFDIAVKTLEAVKIPLSAEEIWEKSDELGTRAGFETKGKTPALSLGARCYMDIVEKGEQSEIYQYSSRPSKFYLTKYKEQHFSDDLVSLEHKKETIKKDDLTELALHPLLTYFVRANPHFRALTKTINHTKSKRTSQVQNMWLFPDLVGVHYPFDDYRPEVLELQQQVSANSVRFYSFEMKKKLSLGNLRESYFQAVSNSSWANEGYLVALTIDTNDEFQEELRRLNSAFGIGVIRLDENDPNESEIVYPSREVPSVNWDTINKLADINEIFQEFLVSVKDNIKLKRVTNKSDYDEVFSVEKLENYLESKSNEKKKK